MPIEFGLWRIDNDEFMRVPSGKLDDESRLEKLLTKDPNLLGRDSPGYRSTSSNRQREPP